MASENDRTAMGNAGANSDKVEQRQTSGEEEPPRPARARRGDRHASGADTPAGPNARSTTDNSKREREKQKEIAARDKQRLQGEEKQSSKQ